MTSPRVPRFWPYITGDLKTIIEKFRFHDSQVAADHAETDTSADEPQTSYQWDNYRFEGSEADPDETLSPPEDHKTGNLAPPTTPIASTSFTDLLSGQSSCDATNFVFYFLF